MHYQGNLSPALNKDAQFVSTDGEFKTGDLTTTYIPLADLGTGQPVQVLEVAREVTDVLSFRVDNARDSMSRTLFTTLSELHSPFCSASSSQPTRC